MGPLLDCSGYAAAGRGYLLAAEAAGLRLRAQDRSRSSNLRGKGMDERILALYERARGMAVSRDCPLVQHQVPDQFYLDKRTRLRIGYTIFEMRGVPRRWVDFCGLMDVIWTGSAYSRAAFLASCVKAPIKVLPHALDLSVLGDKAEPWRIANRRAFAFLSVFDFTERKAWRELLRAYWHAFPKGSDVCLVLKVFSNAFSDECTRAIMGRIMEWKEEVAGGAGAPILLYGHDVPGSQMAGLYRAADCYVGVSREGFGLPFAEAMACGLACVGPEVGGNREFMTEKNSFLVKYVGDEPVGREAATADPAFEGLRWARHSWEHLAETMRKVVEDKEERLARANKGMGDVRSSLSPEAVGRTMNDLLP